MQHRDVVRVCFGGGRNFGIAQDRSRTRASFPNSLGSMGTVGSNSELWVVDARVAHDHVAALRGLVGGRPGPLFSIRILE